MEKVIRNILHPSIKPGQPPILQFFHQNSFLLIMYITTGFFIDF